MGYHTDELLQLARQVSPEPKPRELDMLISVGERISCALVAMAISDLGTDAVSLTGSQAGIVTDTAHGKAKIVEVKAHRIHSALDDDRIVLVAGFQGVSTEYDVTTLGRGGSDTTAVALAAALGADACEIYTDVDGVFTADPRVVSAAQKLHAVSYEEMLELAASGAKSCATLGRVRTEPRRDGARALDVHRRAGHLDQEEDERMLEKALISGVTHTVEEAVYEVDGVRPADLFEALAAAEVNARSSRWTPASSSPRRSRTGRRPSRHWQGSAPASRAGGPGEGERRGRGDEEPSGVAARTFATLRELGVEPKFVATSPIKIAFYVPQESVSPTVAALHEVFELGSPQAERQHDA